MGQARIQLSWEFMQQFLDLPNEWKPTSIYIHEDFGGQGAET